MAAARPAPPFRLGTKQVFLPPVVVSMIPPIRRQPPNYVNFRVPLSFNKFDLRDYLYNAYSCPVLGVRSWVINSKPAKKRLLGVNSRRRSGPWYRPLARKYMSVRLAEPFVIPARPSDADLKPWDHDLYRSVQADRQVMRLNQPQGRKEVPKPPASLRRGIRMLKYYHEILPHPRPGELVKEKHMATRARQLLNGQEKWKGNGAELDEKWVDLARQLKEKERWKMGLLAGPSGVAVGKKPGAGEVGEVRIKGKGMVATGAGKQTSVQRGKAERNANDPS